MRILFYDPLTAFPYDAELMKKRGIGGTESSVIRVAEGLSRSHEVAVAQRAREEPAVGNPRLRYVPLDFPTPFQASPPDWVVVLRKHRSVPKLRTRFPDAALALWIHNWQRAEVVIHRIGLAKSRCIVVAVSDAHRKATDRRINGVPAKLIGRLAGDGQPIPVQRIYNPVDIPTPAEEFPVDPDKLLFFSTANKGLDQVLRTFQKVRNAIPSMKLYIAGETLESLKNNPRYSDLLLEQPGVTLLGRLPQRELFAHIRESLCVFYPQNIHPETFGLVFAESNALGTPVLAHDFGAAGEVLCDRDQLVAANDTPAIIDRLRRWRNGERPSVYLREGLKLDAVVSEWQSLFEKFGPNPHR